ncbi:alpha/beta fold hydrolase [Pontixanthobacter aquaemixtae]|uniref:Alpha/beta fold hydrolase n=1 Tax=Pontixanthobacter aquaemixtae TaxID=1958940 RepID=A0A844ZUY9_9SPHN|nr:alpha/beta hydrolase [Pontixanthobacter aquaemixtae]MXO91102.1 alpha/beta fold hydrolase [Pontixanthobacter aquaemixtae]
MDAVRLTLHNGPLSFSATAMGSGPTVLCLHGFPDNATSFRQQLPFLAENGYRAVAVTLRGYEPGSIPADGDYSMQELVSDVVAWVEELGGDPVHIVGHDWGAAIAYSAAAFAPDKFRSAAAMAVPHPTRFGVEARRYPKQAMLSWYMLFFQLRGLSERIVRARDFAFIKWLWRKWSPGWTPSHAEMGSVIATLRQPGVLEASLGYYRAALGGKKPPASGAAQQHFKLHVPILAMTGARDGCVDTAIFEKLLHDEDHCAGLRFERVQGAGHFLHQEKPDACNAILLDWLKGNS